MNEVAAGTALVSKVEIRQLRCLVAIADAGTFTDAAIELGVSQAAVSRTLASLEAALGVRLLRRTTRVVSPTSTGVRVLVHARRLLADLDSLVEDAISGHDRLRLGYAWSAAGRHTVALQRRWPLVRPNTGLALVRTNTPTGGLAEGRSDVAIVRAVPDSGRFDSVVVGTERRYAALAADDPWARRRAVHLAELADRPLGIDRRTGTTTLDLWPADRQPATVIDIFDVDDWLGLIAAGTAVGMTSEATVDQYPRPGVVYRPVPDVPPIEVRLAWWRDDPHPATGDLVELLTTLFRKA